jgi:hypothetical protein
MARRNSAASSSIALIAASLLDEKLSCTITWSMPTANGVDIHGESEA